MENNSSKISKSGKKNRNFISFTEYKNLDEKEFYKKAEEVNNYIRELEERIKELNVSGIENTTEREKTERALREIEWMLHDANDEKAEYVPEYGDLSSLNKEGMILNLLGKKQLKNIVDDYLHLLETSAAIYERNGDYALGVFSSGWCRMMDAASRKLCNTSDNRKAMKSGKWLCHESCWRDASLPSIKEGKAVDVKCNGGINLYAMPIRTNGEITGSINIGYGTPPTDNQSLKDLSAKYKIPVEKLREKAKSYPARPRFITDLAKKRLRRSALFMESLIESKLAQEAVAENNEQMRITLNSIGDAVISTDIKGRVIQMNPVAEKLTGWRLDRAKGLPLSKVFNIVNAKTGKRAENPVKKVLKTGHIVGLANHTKLISRKGKEYQIADSGAPIKDSHNAIKGVVIVFRDVTEEYELQENLTESERTLNKAQEIGKMGSWKFDLSTGKVSASAEARKIYGFDAGEDLTIEKVQKIPLPGFRNKLNDALHNLVTGQARYDVEFIIKNRKRGKYIDIHSVAEYNAEQNTVTGILQDVSEIKESENKYKNLFSSIRDSLLVTDTNRKIVNCNPAFTDLFGYTQEEIIGKNTSIIYKDPGEFEMMGQKLKESMNIPNFILTLSFKKKNGKLFRGETTVFYLKNKNGETEGYIGMIRDVTARLKAEEKLKESEDKMQSIFKVAPVGIGLVLNRNILEVNKKICEMTGYSENELTGKNARILYPSQAEYNRVGEKKYNQIKKRSIGVVETRWQDKNGKRLDILLASTPMDINDLEKGYIFTALDITDRKQFEEKLKKSEARFRSLAESAPVGVVISDKNEKTLYANKRFKDLFGYTSEDMPSVKEWWPLAYPDQEKREKIRKNWEKTIQDAQQKKSPVQPMVHPVTCKDGTVKFIEFRISSKGGLNFIIFTDMTKLHRTITELQSAKAKAEESDKLKSAFLANVSHEIRTPMNGILGFLDLLRNAELSKRKREAYLNIINQSGNRLLGTINDIVEISKIESGQIGVKHNNVSLNELMLYYKNFFRPQARQKGIDLRISCILDEAVDYIRTDKSKLESILTNLIKNALKFTDEGYIEIRCKSEKKYLLISVTDTGRGIARDKQKIIFDRFVQADLAINRSYEGSGLGLAITKAYVEMMGGNIRVESEPGKGSVFEVRLPFVPIKNPGVANKKNLQEQSPIDGSKKIILIAEDDETSFMFLEEVLQEQNFKIIRACNGKEAVDICKKNPDISLVLMDLKMPEMDGHSATKKIREFNKEVPIIAQTAYVQKEEGKKALESGCNAFIEKPIKAKILKDNMKRLLVMSE